MRKEVIILLLQILATKSGSWTTLFFMLMLYQLQDILIKFLADKEKLVYLILFN